MSARIVALPIAVAVAGVALLWFTPLLGALVLIGAVGALGVVVIPTAVDRIAGWLSGAPIRRGR